MKIMPSPERLGLFMVCPSVNNAEEADGGVFFCLTNQHPEIPVLSLSRSTSCRGSSHGVRRK